MAIIQNFINGQYQGHDGLSLVTKIDPATGQESYQVPNSSPEIVDQAVSAARQAWPPWARMRQSARSRCLNRLADLLEAQLEDFAVIESEDTGKPLWLARTVDIPRAVANFRFFAQAPLHWSSDSFHHQAGLNYTLRQPLGVAGCISPWNLPLYLFSWKVAPALAIGNTVVGKPSEVTPRSAAMLGSLIQEAGFPPGTFNIIHGAGDPTGAHLVGHHEVSCISFTGGSSTGYKIAEVAARSLKKTSLELGGKNPALVFADCDFDLTVSETIRSSFTNQGEICLCSSRIYIEESIYQRFKEAFVAKVQQLIVGDPQDPNTHQGAIVSQEHHGKILAAIATAQAEGGQILTGGEAFAPPGRCQQGLFVLPTVIEGLAATCRTNQEEIFGPVVTLQPFRSDQEAITLANHSLYGLSATIWTQNLKRAHQIAAALQVGVVWINTWLTRDLRTPFGGQKNSGWGREGGYEALRFFTEAKNICLAWEPS